MLGITKHSHFRCRSLKTILNLLFFVHFHSAHLPGLWIPYTTFITTLAGSHLVCFKIH